MVWQACDCSALAALIAFAAAQRGVCVMWANCRRNGFNNAKCESSRVESSHCPAAWRQRLHNGWQLPPSQSSALLLPFTASGSGCSSSSCYFFKTHFCQTAPSLSPLSQPKVAESHKNSQISDSIARVELAAQIQRMCVVICATNWSRHNSALTLIHTYKYTHTTHTATAIA